MCQSASRHESEIHDSTAAARGQYSKFLHPVLCCAAVLSCVLLAWPFANSAFNDDCRMPMWLFDSPKQVE